MSEEEGIKFKKSENLSEWFIEVVRKGEFADYSAVKGCMVVKPNGYFIWQKIQDYFNSLIISDGVRNAYFPLLIPESLLKKEAAHFEGFTPEVAWVGGKTDEDGSERLAIRPTSETIICSEVAGWVRSHRDLPIRLNQWCSVVRWETKTTRLFLRTREFLWQEGHTFWADKAGAEEEVLRILEFYKRVAEELLAVPVLKGIKTDAEKFAGAVYTTTIEAMMPDGKALQYGTSHYLGQEFSRAFGVKFLDEKNREQFAHYNTWGFSTRQIGALLMLHGDDKGAVIPPLVAETQAVVIPIYFKEAQKEEVLSFARSVHKNLLGAGVRAKIDESSDKTPGWKFNQYELVGVPVRAEVGPRDVEKRQVVVVRRDTGEKSAVPAISITDEIPALLGKIQAEMLSRAKARLAEMTIEAKTPEELREAIGKQNGFVVSPWCGEADCEKKFNEETGGTIRFLPLDGAQEATGKCLACGSPAKKIAYYARAY
ncbi:MAG: proline--tRNA ligase [archaeon]